MPQGSRAQVIARGHGFLVRVYWITRHRVSTVVQAPPVMPSSRAARSMLTYAMPAVVLKRAMMGKRQLHRSQRQDRVCSRITAFWESRVCRSWRK